MKHNKQQLEKTRKRRKIDKIDPPSEADLLIELATLDEVSAWIPTATEQEAEIVPDWCELVLEMRRTDDWPINSKLPLRRHDGELLIEVLHKVLHPQAGRNLFQLLWKELDNVIDRLMDGTSEAKKMDRGVAQGITLALAIMTNPYAYDEDAIRDQAMERHESRVRIP